MMRHMIAAWALIATAAGCDAKKANEAASVQTDRGECVRKGVAYFKEIGSFPTLSDGRDATEVALERCERTPGAFDSYTDKP